MRMTTPQEEPTAEELSKLSPLEFAQLHAAVWGKKMADLDARRTSGRSPFWDAQSNDEGK